MTTTTFTQVRAAAVSAIEALTPGILKNGGKRFVCVDRPGNRTAMLDRMFDVALREPPAWAATTPTSTPRYSMAMDVQVAYIGTRDQGEDGARIAGDATQIQEALAATSLVAPLLAPPGPVTLDTVDGNYQLNIGFTVLLQ